MFSVIIPVHNKFPHLDRSVNSVLNQSLGDFELLLINDASTDGSEEKIKKYQDPRIRVFHREIPGPGGYAARNLGITKAKYEWIAFLDADDKWNKNYLFERKKLLEKEKGIQLISSKWVNNKEGKDFGDDKFSFIKKKYYDFNLTDFLNFNQLIWTGSVTIKKSLLEQVNGFPEGKCKRGGDLDTWIRCLYKGEGRNVFVNKSLSVYYQDTVNQVTDNKKNPVSKLCSYDTLKKIRENESSQSLLNAIDKFCVHYVYSTIIKNFRNNGKIELGYLSMINSKKIKYKLLIKVYLYLLLIRLKVR